MCSAFTPLSGYDNSVIKSIGSVYCPITRRLDILCVHKRIFQPLNRSNYQSPHCSSTCQVGNAPLEEQINSSFLKIGRGIIIFQGTQKSIQDFSVDVYCPTCSNEKCVHLSSNKTSSFFDCKRSQISQAEDSF